VEFSLWTLTVFIFLWHYYNRILAANMALAKHCLFLRRQHSLILSLLKEIKKDLIGNKV